MSQGKEFGLTRIGQIAVSVRDIGSAVAFYRDTLGMKLMFEAPPQMAFFDCGPVRLMLAAPEKSEHNHPASILYYAVDDIEGAHETLSARGVRFEGSPHRVHRAPDHELWLAFMRDMDDNLLALMSQKPLKA